MRSPRSERSRREVNLVNAGNIYVAKAIAKRLAQRITQAFFGNTSEHGFEFVSASELGGKIYTEIVGRQQVTLERPDYFSESDWRAFKVRDVHELPANFVLNLTDGYIIGRHGWTGISPTTIVRNIWQERGFETETFHRKRANDGQGTAETISLPGASVSLAMPWLPNYYHWTVQVIPRIKLIQSVIDLQSVDHWIITDPSPPYVVEWLQLIGIDPARIVPTANGRTIRCEQLIVSSVPSPNRHVQAWVIEYIRSLAPGLPVLSGPKRLFIARNEGEKRRVVNAEHEAAKAGFEPILLHNKTVAEKISLFQGADCVVGVHGAGLTNMIFCQSSTRILELAPRNLTYPTFWKLSRQRGLRHEFLFGKEPRVPFPFYAPDPFADLIIDSGELAIRLERLAEAIPHRAD